MNPQPLLHDLLAAVMAPTQVWSGNDGQIRSAGAQGAYHADTRVLSCAVVAVTGSEPELVVSGPAGLGCVEAVSLLRIADKGGADPAARLRRRRTVTPGKVHEALEISVATAGPTRLQIALRLACDFASMDAVKAGDVVVPVGATAAGTSVVWTSGPDSVRVTAVAPDRIAGPGPSIDLADPAAPVVIWDLTVGPGAPVTVGWDLEAHLATVQVVEGPPARSTWTVPRVACSDRRLPAFLTQAMADLAGLRMSAAFAPDDVFLAAGAPWFVTLFGRDSLWAARMMLPLGTELASGTLRTLALRQGVVENAETAEQPGKILHEVRGRTLSLGKHGELPPLYYYGTVDATPLWVCLLHDAWRWGMPQEEVHDLLPALEAALTWMADYGDADGDGFLEYLDETGRGLANQGWKDSWDSVQWRDGDLAVGPIALCEVQGYAHEAALAGAELLDAFGLHGADRWRHWARELAARFRERFWVHDEDGPFPAIALDARKRPVDTLTSNIGHLLGTGLLNAEEEDVVAGRLASTALDSGYGLRTLATGSGGYSPLSYHGGSVWTHDTAIAIAGLARSGHTAQAAALIEGVLVVADDFDYRVPELHSGDARGTVPAAVAYPAACRPQAWSAASAVVLLSAILGVRPDVPAGRFSVAPMIPSPVGALTVHGLQLADRRLDIEIDPEGAVRSLWTDADLELG